MSRKILIAAALLMLAILSVACSGPAQTTTPAPPPSTTSPTPTPKVTPAPQRSGPIKGVWIEPKLDADSISIPMDEVESNVNVHFKLEAQDNINFMAYVLDGEIYVRANVCPPCRSIGYSLAEDVLVCDRCATMFEADTGNGIKGACVNYPKASVPYGIADGNIVMKKAALVAAYQDTLKPG